MNRCLGIQEVVPGKMLFCCLERNHDGVCWPGEGWRLSDDPPPDVATHRRIDGERSLVVPIEDAQ